jgi:dTMP kinase
VAARRLRVQRDHEQAPGCDNQPDMINPPNQHPGALIAIEGIDGAGSTTQTEMLMAWLGRAGIPAIFTSEPSKGPIGVTMRLHLGRQLDLGGPQAEALGFAADRMDHVASEVAPALEKGLTVVTDRYYLSSLAYQALSCDLGWLLEINNQKWGGVIETNGIMAAEAD